MKITIEVIPHRQQRYPTVGDWYWRKGQLFIKVSKLANWRHEALIAVHELVEVLMCKHTGVSQAAVDKFDIAYEKARKAGDESEPGDDSKAPYRREHCVATGIERILAAELGVDWNSYADAVEKLP